MPLNAQGARELGTAIGAALRQTGDRFSCTARDIASATLAAAIGYALLAGMSETEFLLLRAQLWSAIERGSTQRRKLL